MNALELAILAAELGDKRWSKMAARWRARFGSEKSGIGPAESAWALTGLGALGGPLPELAAETLRQLARSLQHFPQIAPSTATHLA